MKIWIQIFSFGLLTLSMGGCVATPVQSSHPRHLREIVALVRNSVVTVAAFDVDGAISAIGSGFFIDDTGTLVTNHHVLDGAYSGAVKTAEGRRYPIGAVIARNPVVDLIKVQVAIVPERVAPLVLATEEPQVADRVLVIGSPMGLEQTISEGIVSAVRPHPAGGKIYQLTAPISQGSSGGPALNLKGEVIGVVTFQTAKGQNLNFAISSKILQMLPHDADAPTLTEWTLRKSGSDPLLAATLCRQGSQLSINGEYEAALNYFQQATQADPGDEDAWHGLGSCYVGLNQPNEAVAAFQKSIDANPDSASAHFMLAMFHKALAQYPEAIDALLQVIRIDGENIQARLELADTYGDLDQAERQIASLKAILSFKPDHVLTLHRMGQTVGGMGHHDEALALLLRASSLAPDDAGIYFDIGVTYHQKDQPDKALRAYTQAIRADPRMASAHHNLGLLFIAEGNRKLALQQYEILKSLDKDLAESLFEEIYPETLKAVGKQD